MHRVRERLLCLLVAAIASASVVAQSDVQRSEESRPRARDIGLVIGIFEPGEMNAITDVGNVKVGHTTVFRGDDIRTGVTAIIPAEGNLYTHPIARVDPRGQWLWQAHRRDSGKGVR